MKIYSILGEEKKVLRLMDEWFLKNRNEIEEEDYYDLRTAVAEACLNAIEHGNRLDPSLTVDVEFSCFNGVVTVKVKDYGTGFSHTKQRDQDQGWGLKFIQSCVDHYKFYNDLQENRQFCIEMKKRLRGKEKRVNKHGARINHKG